MALPISATPKYKLTIPSMKKSVSFRPFLVKEEKALLIAQQSEDPEVMLQTIKSVITSCISEKIDVDALALFDVEYIFAQLRAKSVGEIVELILQCDNCDDKKATVQVQLDLTKLQVHFPEDHKKTIPLFNDVGVIMKYPSLDLIKKMESMNSNSIESIFDVICNSIEAVYDSNEMFYTKDQKIEEVREFIDNLTQEQFKKLQNFFETMPKLEEKVKYKCPLCAKDHEKYIRGLESFF